MPIGKRCLGHPLKFLWEEKAQNLTTYSNFWKQFYRKFPQYREASVTAREFEPGERVEVDYAGEPLEWIELKSGEIRKAWVFVAGLGFSQLLFAWAAEDMKSRNWLGCHRRMFAYYGGVAHVTVLDFVPGNKIRNDVLGDATERSEGRASSEVPARIQIHLNWPIAALDTIAAIVRNCLDSSDLLKDPIGLVLLRSVLHRERWINHHGKPTVERG